MSTMFYDLNNGTMLPAIGLGASIVPRGNGKIKGNEQAVKQWQMYKYAMMAYDNVFFDMSTSYGLSEYVLGNVIQTTGMREKIYIGFKISNSEQREGNIKEVFEKHLVTLNTDYVDILMMHWPHLGTFVSTWKVFEEIYAMGKAKAIGVSNFHSHHLEELMKAATVKPAVNQIEVHPLFTQQSLRQCCDEMGIRIMAYTPLGRMHDVLMKNRTLRNIAVARKKTVPQIILRWDLDSGMATIPKTLTPTHFDEIMAVESFSLTAEEIAAIDAVNENVRLRFNPDTVDYTMIGR